jgi:3-phenylpropionate/trans-cinnamate dioxygenase ferredoxin subunit
VPFLKVGRDADFGPGMRALSILGRKIGIFRGEDGRLRAMEVACRHQNADLTQGSRDGDVVTCPRHGWRYDLRTGECRTEPWARLRSFALEVRDGEVFVSTSPLEEPP